jgi:small ligand-binding sensory domain FIST
MQAFSVGHATHPDAATALALAAAQIEGAWSQAKAGARQAPTLGFLYLSDHYASAAGALLADVQARWPGVAWVGAVGVGVAASGVEYFDEPGLALMLAALPPSHFEVFSGARPLSSIAPYTALVHADPATPDIDELIAEMSRRTATGYLFGGLASSRGATLHIADEVLRGGLSGVAFSRDVTLISRVSQGCQPIGPTRLVTRAERNVVIELDGKSALPQLLADLQIQSLDKPREVMPRLQATLVGLTGASEPTGSERRSVRAGQFGPDTRVRHLIGLDPGRQAVAVADIVEPGMQLAFCKRDATAARRDLVRICAEIRDEVESSLAPQRMAGAIFVSCSGRGGAHFGGPSAELQIVQHALGEVPLVGFFANGEIARHHLYGYTGVLTVFTAPA